MPLAAIPTSHSWPTAVFCAVIAILLFVYFGSRIGFSGQPRPYVALIHKTDVREYEVELLLWRNGIMIGEDRGVVRFWHGRLCFEGSRTSFSIPGSEALTPKTETRPFDLGAWRNDHWLSIPIKDATEDSRVWLWPCDPLDRVSFRSSVDRWVKEPFFSGDATLPPTASQPEARRLYFASMSLTLPVGLILVAYTSSRLLSIGSPESIYKLVSKILAEGAVRSFCSFALGCFWLFVLWIQGLSFLYEPVRGIKALRYLARHS